MFQFLEEFLDMLNQTEARKNVKLIASNQTVESLRVTLMSVLSIIEFLHNEGVSYILTAKLNQDPLEVRVLLPRGNLRCLHLYFFCRDFLAL